MGFLGLVAKLVRVGMFDVTVSMAEGFENHTDSASNSFFSNYHLGYGNSSGGGNWFYYN